MVRRRATACSLALAALEACWVVACPKAPTTTALEPEETAQQARTWRESAGELWPNRADPARLSGALSRYEQAWQADPSDRMVAERLTRGWLFRALVQEPEPAPRLEALDRAVRWGEACLALNPKFTAIRARPDETVATALRALSVIDAPCLYWLARALDARAHTAGRARVLDTDTTTLAMMQQVEDLQAGFNFGGPDRFMGAHLATLPAFAGRDLDAARSHLERAMATAPQYLDNAVVTAETWAVAAGDRPRFEALLEGVLAQNAPGEAELAPENDAARARARALLAAADVVFGPPRLLPDPIEGAVPRIE